MKKLYVLIFFLVIGRSFGQILQNANWIFGQGQGVTFNTTPPTSLSNLPLEIGYDTEEGCANISDNNGNLLFFTDGNGVWLRMTDGSNQLITNQLLGDGSSAQNTIIVHKPGSPNNYYIFAIRGETGDYTNRGLYYSEIEINYPDVNIIFLNQPLNDDLGNPIQDGWSISGNIAEAITSTTHSDNYQYWVEAFVGINNGDGKILSFLVTDLGVINNNPTSTLVFTAENFANAIKINNSRIAVASDSGLYLGDFNNTTGVVTINQQIPPIGNITDAIYSAEFSPSGNNLYFTSISLIGLYSIETNKLNYIVRNEPNATASRLQIAIDDKIYFTNGYSPFLSIIATPDNFSAPTVLFNQIPLTFQPLIRPLSLPQLVSIQPLDGPCVNTIGIRKSTTDMFDFQQASNTIIASNTIFSGNTAVYHAGVSVVLQSGFHAESGSIFRGYIEGCTDEFGGKNNSVSKHEKIRENENRKFEKPKVFPNPSNSFSEITIADCNITQVSLYSLEGKILKTINEGSKEKYRLNTEDLTKGIYYLIIKTNSNKIYSEKLIKN